MLRTSVRGDHAIIKHRRCRNKFDMTNDLLPCHSELVSESLLIALVAKTALYPLVFTKA